MVQSQMLYLSQNSYQRLILHTNEVFCFVCLILLKIKYDTKFFDTIQKEIYIPNIFVLKVNGLSSAEFLNLPHFYM